MPTAVRDRLLPDVIVPEQGPPGLDRAELAAAVLDGDVHRLADAFIPIDLPIAALERAAALRPLLRPRCIIARRTAAWVWGAVWQLEEPISCFVRQDAQTAPLDPARVLIHEVVLADGDVVEAGGVPITSPLRTAMDLARAPAETFDQQALGRMLGIAGIDAVALRDELARRPRLPGRRPALQRLQVLFTR